MKGNSILYNCADKNQSHGLRPFMRLVLLTPALRLGLRPNLSFCRALALAIKKVVAVLLYVVITMRASSQSTTFLPGEIWRDTNGDTINAHGGGILYANNVYYW